MKKIMELKATNGIIIVYDDRVVFSRKTFAGFMTQGGASGDRTYFYNDLAFAEYKKPNMMLNGYLKMVLKGTNDIKSTVGIAKTSTATLEDPNTITLRAFNKNIPIESEKIFNYIQSKIEETKKINTKATQTFANYSKADELKKLAELRNSGILTEEEFLNEKSKILSRKE